ncbi:MAG: SHOCT domain-containing protein [Acidimicrobiia bacterium]
MPVLDFIWTMFLFFLLILWIWLVITVFIDIFRNHEMSGWAKAGWTIFIIIVPWLGVLVYLIVHGGDMQRRRIDEAAKIQAAQNDYIRDVATSGSTADELEKLKKLHDQGVLTDDEYAAQKAKVLA